MAEMMMPPKNDGKKTSKRNFVRVDMTPMVDLGFLLITFFMFTTSFLKPNIMDLGLPAKGGEGNEIDPRNQITFILGEKDRIFYYQKDVNEVSSKDFKETTYSGMELVKLINSKKKIAPKPENFTLIIKPTDSSSYKNFVDVLDDIAISKNERYGLSKLNKNEEIIYKGLVK